jgi:hypothetical protein
MVEKTAAFKQRRAADTARWRERLHRGAAIYPVEAVFTRLALSVLVPDRAMEAWYHASIA